MKTMGRTEFFKRQRKDFLLSVVLFFWFLLSFIKKIQSGYNQKEADEERKRKKDERRGRRVALADYDGFKEEEEDNVFFLTWNDEICQRD